MQENPPWPVFRYDRRNTGCSAHRIDFTEDHPWMFQTGKGIFSTPIIDQEGVIYVGSADHTFYALNPDGTSKWHFETGEIIDSAGALLTAADGTAASVLVPSGDGNLYCLGCENGDIIWKFDARVHHTTGYNNWWEANVTIDVDGTIYAGNTNFNYYAIHPNGTMKWTYQTGANAWSAAAFADDGTIYWGSNDTFIHAVYPNGVRKWKKRTLGFIAASAAIGTDGTVYIGSFDSNFYALNPDNGRVRWKFRSHDHIYSSAALLCDTQGRTSAIYFGSADGNLYGLTPDGILLWHYDTGAPIRSSPVVGPKPQDEEGWIVYFGCGNGKVYALDAANGSRRWSYDTTPIDTIIRDRNDLNGSPALGKTGVYIGGEHGQLWYIPYDYPLHHDDPRGCLAPVEDKMQQTETLYYVTPGGNLKRELPDKLPAATIITFRLMKRNDKAPRDARLSTSGIFRRHRALNVIVDPPFEFDIQVSADGRHLHIIPRSFLEMDQTYNIQIRGYTYSGGLHIGNLTIGGRRAGNLYQQFTIRTAPPTLKKIPLQANNENVTAFEISRFAVPIPTMLPSLNQIGFDYMDWIAGVVAITKPGEDCTGKLILWAVGGKRNKDGVLVVDPQTNFLLPLSGAYQNDAFILTNNHFEMPITGIPIHFNVFQMRGCMQADMVVGASATAYADTKVLSIPTFGPLLVLAGLASNWWQNLLATATYVTHPYIDGPANQRPHGISVRSIHFRPPTRANAGQVTAYLDCEVGYAYPSQLHLTAILLIDDNLCEAVAIDYLSNLESTADDAGNVRSVILTVPVGTILPPALSAVVLLDVFPLHREVLI